MSIKQLSPNLNIKQVRPVYSHIHSVAQTTAKVAEHCRLFPISILNKFQKTIGRISNMSNAISKQLFNYKTKHY